VQNNRPQDERQPDRQADRGFDGWFLDRLFGIRRN
jgi:hypothetical protein